MLDVGGGRHSPLSGLIGPHVTRIRLDISSRFGPDVVGDAHAMPVRDCSVGSVLLSEVLEHVAEPQQVLAETRRIMRCGGVLLGSVPFSLGPHADPEDFYRYTELALRRLLGDFTDVDVRPHGNHVSSAWRALNTRWHWLWVFNPLAARLGRRSDPRWPEGFTFVASVPSSSVL